MGILGFLGAKLFSTSKYMKPQKVLELIENGIEHKIIDVRSPEEFASGHIKNAINIPLPTIENKPEVLADEKEMIFVYCQSGMRSNVAATKLTHLGYENAYNIGGISSWPDELV